MSFRGLEFIRQWVTQHIYRPRIKGSVPSPAPVLAEILKHDVKAAPVDLQEIEEEVGSVEVALEKALEAGRLRSKNENHQRPVRPMTELVWLYTHSKMRHTA